MIRNVAAKAVNLKELCTAELGKVQLKLLLKHDLNQLRGISIKIRRYSSWGNQIQQRNELMQEFINKIINQIEYIGLIMNISSNGKVQLDEMDIISKASNKVDFDNMKKRFKIRIDGIKFYETKDVEDMITSLKKLILYLDLKCKNWMVLCHGIALKREQEQEQVALLYDFYKNLEDLYEYHVDRYGFVDCDFVVGNDECNQWIYQNILPPDNSYHPILS